MRTTLYILATALGCATGGVSGATRAGAQTCRPADSLSADLIAQIVQYTAATDPGWIATRDSLRLPAAAASAVTLVTKEARCQSAVTAYRNESLRWAGTGHSGRVYAVKVGQATYVVWDPEYSYNASLPTPQYMTFDSRWRLLSKW